MSQRNPVAPLASDDHVRGADKPTITIIEYGDYDCPHTRAAQLVVDKILAEQPDVRIVFRHFPLRHLHPNAESLSRIAESSARQGKYWPMHDHLMHHTGSVDERGLIADAHAVNVDLDKIAKDFKDAKIAARVERDVASGLASGVHSTPTFFFEGQMHDGHYDYRTLCEQLEAARDRV